MASSFETTSLLRSEISRQPALSNTLAFKYVNISCCSSFERNLEINDRNFFLDSDPCTKDCGPGGTCLKESLMAKDDAVCRCDEGFNKTEDGKCVGRCSLIKHYP